MDSPSESLCRQHNISSSFGTTVSSTSAITPTMSNSSSVVTIGLLPANAKTNSSSMDNSMEGTGAGSATGVGGGGSGAAAPLGSRTNFQPRTYVDELKDEVAAEKATPLKDSIENLEILLKNNISLSDLSNKQQLNLRTPDTGKTLLKKDTIVTFRAETLVSYKRKSVTTITSTMRRASHDDCSALITRTTAATALEAGEANCSANGSCDADENRNKAQRPCDWLPRQTLEPQRSPIKSSQSMSPLGLATEVFVMPNSRSMIVISSSSSSGSTSSAYMLQDVST